jgi:hypothetical protein
VAHNLEIDKKIGLFDKISVFFLVFLAYHSCMDLIVIINAWPMN